MSRLNYIEKRKKLRRKVMQGFPWNGKFKTKQEIYSYFSGDRIQCLLCGKWFKKIPTHLKMIHDIGSDEYRERYGLPWRHGLCGKEVSLKLSKAMKERREHGFLPDIDAAREKSKHAKARQDQPFFKKIKAENTITDNAKRQKYFHDDFQNVLGRMVDENKALEVVCKDADMPSSNQVYQYARRNKRFRKALDETYKRLSFSRQGRARKLSEPKFMKKQYFEAKFHCSEKYKFFNINNLMIQPPQNINCSTKIYK